MHTRFRQLSEQLPMEAVDSAYDSDFATLNGSSNTELDLLSYSDGQLTIDMRANKTDGTYKSSNKRLDIFVNDQPVVEGAGWRNFFDSTQWVSNEFTIPAEPGDSIRVEWIGWDEFSDTDGLSGTLEATVPTVPKPAFEIVDCSIAASEVSTGSETAVTLSVTNTGDADGEASLILTAGGETIYDTTVQIATGETIEETIAVSFDTPGEYDLKPTIEPAN